MFQLLARWLLGVSLACAIPAFSFAQGPAPTASAEQRAAYESLFQQSLRQPTNIELAFRFADSASQIGDYEASIGALERILFYNPGLGRVRLELGVLYFRLGSFAQARSYFTSVIEQGDIPLEVRLRVQSFLSEIERRDKTSTFSGFAQFGYRHQTNANAGPDSRNVRVFGLDGILGDQFRRTGDGSVFALAGFRHVFDFETQRGETWETTAQAYISRQFRFNRFDLTLGEVTTGPRVPLAPELWPGLSIRPYAILSGVILGQSPYLASSGFGAALQLPVMVSGTTVEVGGEYRKRVFYALPDASSAVGQTGALNNVYATVSTQVLPWLKASARIYQLHNTARDQFNAYRQNGWDASLAIEFDAPAMVGGRRWTIAPFVGQSWSDFKDVNLLIDPRIVRRDTDLRYGVSLEMPINDNFGVSAQVLVARTDSNLPNYRTRGVTTIIGPSFRF